MRALIRILAVLLLLAIVVAGIEVGHKKGLMGLLRELQDSVTAPPAPPPQAHEGTLAAPAVAKPAEKAPVQRWGNGATKELGWADRDYDRGDFDGAVANYNSSRILAANAGEKDRAERGLEKSLLGWALVRGARKVEGRQAELDAAYAKQLAAAEAGSDERAWVDLVRWTAGAGMKDRLPYVVGQALDRARPGGHVQVVLDESVTAAGFKKDMLISAMHGRGLGTGPALATIPVPATPSTDTNGTAAKPPEEPIVVPYGTFSADMLEKLHRAMSLEIQGTAAYKAAGPESRTRAESRATALKCLKEAREIYVAAVQQDSASRDLDRRLTRVTQMIAQLRKDEALHEK